jgi:hypothetical protein
MSNNLPIIRIKDAWLLRESVSTSLNELWGEGKPLRSDEEYAQIVKNYIEAWLPYEEKILTSMEEILGLQFRQEMIDVYIAPWFSAFSDPLVIGVRLSPDEFIDTLTHELLHRLLTDNTLVSTELFLLPEWEKLFGKELTFTALVHIPVHAVHKAIYLDVLKEPERLVRDIENNKSNQAIDYIAAWEYVNKNDYNEIIEKLKNSYKELSENKNTN